MYIYPLVALLRLSGHGRHHILATTLKHHSCRRYWENWRDWLLAVGVASHAGRLIPPRLDIDLSMAQLWSPFARETE